MHVVPFQEIHRIDWDAIAETSCQAWLFHRHDWITLEQNYAGADNISFGIMEKDRLIAIAPLYISRLGLGHLIETLVHDSYHRQTGLAMVSDLDAVDRASIRATWIKKVESAAELADADRIHLARQNLAPASLGPEREEIPHFVTENRFQLGQNFGPLGVLPAPGLSTAVADQIVELDAEEADLFMRLKESCRRAVRKAEKAGAVFKEITHEQDPIAIYYKLAQLSAERTGEQLVSIDYYRAIHSRFSATGRCSVHLVEIKGCPCAAIILLHDKNGVYFLSGVSDPSFLERRVNDYLHWSVIRWSLAKGFAHYRLGPYFPSVPMGWPIESVSRFKTKFGGRSWSIVQGSRFLKPLRYVEAAQTHIRMICEQMST